VTPGGNGIRDVFGDVFSNWAGKEGAAQNKKTNRVKSKKWVRGKTAATIPGRKEGMTSKPGLWDRGSSWKVGGVFGYQKNAKPGV